MVMRYISLHHGEQIADQTAKQQGGTINKAVYQALIMCIEFILQTPDIHDVVIRSNSKMLVKQIKGEMTVGQGSYAKSALEGLEMIDTHPYGIRAEFYGFDDNIASIGDRHSGFYKQAAARTNKKLKPQSTMPFGKHKGLSMSEVPLDYFRWLSKQNKLSPNIKKYIDKYVNLNALL